MQRHTMTDRQATPTTPPDYLDALRAQIGNAADYNNDSALARLRCNAMGAFYATGRDAFRELAYYACDIEGHIKSRRRGH